MPTVKCPVPTCDYQTDEKDAVIVAALITAHSVTHANATSKKVDKLKRPTISTSGTSEDWEYFKTRWDDYVRGTNISGGQVVIELLECCDEPLRKDLMRTYGSLTNKTQTEVLKAIKCLAIREENKMVARVSLHNMRQDHDEAIRLFAARLRGQATVCQFTMKCSHCQQEVNYKEEILRDALIRGIADNDIQFDILGDSNQNRTPEEIINFVEVKESGKTSAAGLMNSQGAEAANSSYKHRGKELKKNETCIYCGKNGHGKRASPNYWKKNCSAYGHTCTHCSKQHHFEILCRSKANDTISNEVTDSDDIQGAVFDTLCALTHSSGKGRKMLVLSHHIYNALSDTWIKCSSKQQPFIKVTAHVSADDYEALGHDTALTPRSAMVSGMADTGCQSCLAGTGFLQCLGLSKGDLIPVTMKMHAANSEGIKIFGAIIARFSAKTVSGETLHNKADYLHHR